MAEAIRLFKNMDCAWAAGAVSYAIPDLGPHLLWPIGKRSGVDRQEVLRAQMLVPLKVTPTSAKGSGSSGPCIWTVAEAEG